MSTGETSTDDLPSSPDAAQLPPQEPGEGLPVSHLVFPVGGFGLMVAQKGEMEFLENQTPFHIPNNHPKFRGLINRRGSLVPVFDIRELLDDRVRRNDDKVLVLGRGEDAAGIVLDEVPYRVMLGEEHRAAPPDRLNRVFGDALGDCYARDGTYQVFVAMDQYLYKLAHDPNL